MPSCENPSFSGFSTGSNERDLPDGIVDTGAHEMPANVIQAIKTDDMALLLRMRPAGKFINYQSVF
ncbi:MAG: hypothetical protein AAGC95_08015 [Pseudomonadota bacterium]